MVRLEIPDRPKVLPHLDNPTPTNPLVEEIGDLGNQLKFLQKLLSTLLLFQLVSSGRVRALIRLSKTLRNVSCVFHRLEISGVSGQQLLQEKAGIHVFETTLRPRSLFQLVSLQKSYLDLHIRKNF